MPIPGEKDLKEVAEDILEEADQDISTDDLTRGTEVYEDEEMNYEEGRDEELDFEPEPFRSSGGFGYFEDNMGDDEY